MKHIFSTALALLLGAQSASSETIRVYNWAEYMDLDLIEEFTLITGIDVIYETYNNSEVVETLLVAGDSGYDVVVVSSEFLSRLRENNSLSEINHGRLATFESMWKEVMDRASKLDADARYSIPFLWGTTGLGYDRDKILAIMPDAPLDSWQMLFDPAIVSQFSTCGVAITDAIEELLAIALSYLGHDPNTSDPDALLQAEELIRNIMPYVTEVGTEQYDIMAKGDACLAMVWSGDAILADENAIEGVNVTYTIPKEGAPLWLDLFVIPSDSTHINSAHMFIDFIQRPENIARASNFSFYANANSASPPFIEPEILANPVIYPDAETLKRLFPIFSRPPEEKSRISRTWRQMQLEF